MDAAHKTLQLQTQVRQNAEVVKNTLNDLFNWEKEIKNKEKQVKSQQDNNNEQDNTLPIRSHIKEQNSNKLALTGVSCGPEKSLSNGENKYDSLLSPSSEKKDIAKDALEMKHAKANEIKDRGNKHVKLSEYEKAIEAYTQAIQLYDSDAVYYSNRALCYLKLESYDECIEDCESAIEIDRLAVKAYYRRMMANECLGNNMDALKDCTTVLMIEPKNIEAKRSLERINTRLHKNVQTRQGPNFSPLRSNLIDILPIDKPAYKRSTKPLSRLAIADVVGPKESKNHENLTISDEDIDKLFNSNCGHFEEIKGPISKDHNAIKTATNVPKETKEEKQEKGKEKKEKDSETETETEKLRTSDKKIDFNQIRPELENKKERPLPTTPISTAQFYSNWKELTPTQKYQYLKSIPLKQLCKILGAGFDSDTLTDIINTLHDFYLMEKEINTAETLLEVSKNKQVSILSLLMSNKERQVLVKIMNSLKEANFLDAATAERISKNFNLN